MGIGFSTLHRGRGRGLSKQFNILGIKMFDSCRDPDPPDRRGHRARRHEIAGAGTRDHVGADRRRGTRARSADIMVEEGDTDTAPYGLGTYASRSTPVAGAAIAMAARRVREKGREGGRAPARGRRSRRRVEGLQVPGQRRACQARHDEGSRVRGLHEHGGNEPGLEATCYYDPPNMTFPYGTYIAVVDVDRETGEVKVRRFLAVDDCGNDHQSARSSKVRFTAG